MSGASDSSSGSVAGQDPARTLMLRYLAQREKRARRRRRKAQLSGFRIADVARLAGVSVRTVRHYVTRQLLVAPEFWGRQTRYDRMHLLRLLALPLLKAQGLRRLNDLRRALDELGEPGLTQLVQSHPLPPETREALGWPAQAPAPPGAAALPDAQSSSSSPAGHIDPAAVQAWQHITLLPGLELLLRADATPFVIDVARQIRERYTAR